MIDKQKQPTELDRLQEWGRVGLALYIATNAVIAMMYPGTITPQNQKGKRK